MLHATQSKTVGRMKFKKLCILEDIIVSLFLPKYMALSFSWSHLSILAPMIGIVVSYYAYRIMISTVARNYLSVMYLMARSFLRITIDII
jgi:hypothetical protein